MHHLCRGTHETHVQQTLSCCTAVVDNISHQCTRTSVEESALRNGATASCYREAGDVGVANAKPTSALKTPFTTCALLPYDLGIILRR